MGTIPVLTSGAVITILRELGFEEARHKGSHKQFRYLDGRNTTVPVHKGRDISTIFLRKIATDIKIPFDEFLSHR